MTFKVALFAALAALVLSTCTAAVSGSPGYPVADGEGGISSSEIPGDAGAVLENPPDSPGAPAKGQPSSPVDSAGQSSELASAPVATKFKFGKVKVLQPQLRVAGLVDTSTIAKIRKLDGIRYAAAFDVAAIGVGTTGKAVTVAAVNPQKFRKLTPAVTANEPAVWQRIVEGDAAFTHDVGYQIKQELQTGLGGFVPAGTQGHALRVGAYASNGIPPIADAMVSPATAQALGMVGRHDVLVSLDEGADTAAVAQRLEEVSRGAAVEVLAAPQELRAYLSGEDARSQFEPYNYVDMGDGMIQIDPDWVSRNIVRRAMPLLNGEVVCHRQMVDQLYGALSEIEQSGLGHLIDPSQYGGCWVPRHIDFNPARPLSMHSWGLAADFNVSTNGLGQKPQMDPRIVHIFDKWGFVWGGRWSRPDGMHFELGAVLANSPQG
jgi:hypothetical protein